MGTRPEHDPQVLPTVLHALQRGDLVAYDGTNPVLRVFWTDKTRQYTRDSTGFLFRREDVLALWPIRTRKYRGVRPRSRRVGEAKLQRPSAI